MGHDRAASSWLRVLVIGLLIAGCGSGSTPTRHSPREQSPDRTGQPFSGSNLGAEQTLLDRGHQLAPVPMTWVATITGEPNLSQRAGWAWTRSTGQSLCCRCRQLPDPEVRRQGTSAHQVGQSRQQGRSVRLPLLWVGRGWAWRRVCRADNARVQQFDDNGKFLSKWVSRGNQDGQFLAPFGIAVDRQGNVYVGDPPLSRVQKFDSDGKFVSTWGSRGSEDGKFSEDLPTSPSTRRETSMSRTARMASRSSTAR